MQAQNVSVFPEPLLERTQKWRFEGWFYPEVDLQSEWPPLIMKHSLDGYLYVWDECKPCCICVCVCFILCHILSHGQMKYHCSVASSVWPILPPASPSALGVSYKLSCGWTSASFGRLDHSRSPSAKKNVYFIKPCNWLKATNKRNERYQNGDSFKLCIFILCVLLKETALFISWLSLPNNSTKRLHKIF